MHNIQIDSEFQAIIPPLSAEERARLEANLLADGCRDPLVVWPSPTFGVCIPPEQLFPEIGRALRVSFEPVPARRMA